jgi:signal transduction histidine kinase
MALLVAYPLAFSLLYPLTATWDRPAYLRLIQFDALVFLGNAALLFWAGRHYRRMQMRRAAAACAVLLVTQLLTSGAALAQHPLLGTHGVVPASLLLYGAIYTGSVWGLSLIVPLGRWGVRHWLRLIADGLLVMTVADLVVYVLITLTAADRYDPLLITLHRFRLVSTLGASAWYLLAYRRLVADLGGGGRFWALGLASMVATDILLFGAALAVSSQGSDWFLGIVIPTWMLHQSCWAIGLERAVQHPIVWHAEPQVIRPVPLQFAWIGPVLQGGLLLCIVGLMLVAPSASVIFWLICAIVSREVLARYEREYFLQRELAANAALTQLNEQITQIADAAQREADEINQQAEAVTTAIEHIQHDARMPVLTLEHLQQHMAEPYRATMAAHVHQLNQLLGQLVGYARASLLPLQRAPLDLDALLAEVHIASLPLFAERGVQLERRSTVRPMHVLGHHDALVRVVWNLLANALYATPTGGTVTLEVQRDPAQDGWLRIAIRDQGPGVPTALVTTIFRGGVSRRGSSGLGLQIVRELMEAMQGRYGVEPAAPRGSSFWIALPIVETPQWPTTTPSS